MTHTPEHVQRALRMSARMRHHREVACDADPTTPGYGKSFMSYYLPHYSRHPVSGRIVPPAEWHDQFDAAVFGTLGMGVTRAFLAPRGYAKSTKVTLVTPLIALARQLKEYIFIVQDTGTQATQAMGQVIHELDANRNLLRDFPHLHRARSRGRYIADRDNDVLLESGARMQAVGAGTNMRGRRNKQARPDLALIDDVENDENVNTRFQRDKLDGWISSALLGAMGPRADVYMVGTLLHHDALLARLMTRWGGFRYEALRDAAPFQELYAAAEQVVTGELGGEWVEAAILERLPAALVAAADAESTWPQLWPAIRLAGQRRRMGSHAFAREYLHQPVDESRQMFPPSRFKYRDTRSRLLAAAPGELSARIRITVDPAVGEKKENDYSAIATCCQLGGAPEYDVLSVWRGKKRQEQLIEQIWQTYDFWRPYQPVVCVEAVQAQAWLAQGLRRHGVNVTELHPQRDKIIRAEPLAVLYENGQVWHDPSLRDGDYELEAQQFPASENDDQVDVVVYGVTELAHRPRPSVTLL